VEQKSDFKNILERLPREEVETSFKVLPTEILRKTTQAATKTERT
jgi:hypothetical protein